MHIFTVSNILYTVTSLVDLILMSNVGFMNRSAFDKG